MLQVTFRALAKLQIQHVFPYSLPVQLGSAHTHPFHRSCSLSSILVHYSVSPHISCSNVRAVSCLHPWTPFPNPKPKSRSVLLRITSLCSIFISIFLCPNPCPFPSTLLCSFWYLYVHNFLYVPQSEIDIDCPLWTPVHLIQTFQTPPVQIEDKRTSGGKASKLKLHPRQAMLSAVIVGSSRELRVT